MSRLRAALGDPPLRFELPDGSAVGASRADARVTLRLRDLRAALELALDPDLALGDLYSEGRIEVDGSLVELMCLTDHVPPDSGPLSRVLARHGAPSAWRQALGRAAGNARKHYDVGNDFYALWLDERMLYTCAYFARPGLSLEEAQLAKLDHVCRKLRLRPGQRVLELGAGWGSLAIHMAREYGARVRAFNVSLEQVAWAREQAEKQGVASRVEFVLDDYRNATGRYDAFASIGMLEHVGPAHFEELGCVIARTLAPEGLGLIHTIGRSRPQPLNRWVATRIFPNAHAPSLSEMMRVFEPHDFAVLDVENLRRHYELTAAEWLARFQKNRRVISKQVPEATARAFELYLAGTVAAFRCAWMCLYQVVFTRAKNDAIPWTRADLYGN
ncbi:MAG: class I SAM-dependent methyltransferase [Myxococcota bacterium]|jgi:cyclopropane-fatty-acyl-phospholipid synthase